MENIPSQYNTRVMFALLFRNLKLLTFEYSPKYDFLSKHLRSLTHQIQMPLFRIRILEPLFFSVYVINISHKQHVSNFRNKALCSVFPCLEDLEQQD